jgi:hypothetical protein
MISKNPPEHGIQDWTDIYRNKGSGKEMQIEDYT